MIRLPSHQPAFPLPSTGSGATRVATAAGIDVPQHSDVEPCLSRRDGAKRRQTESMLRCPSGKPIPAGIAAGSRATPPSPQAHPGRDASGVLSPSIPTSGSESTQNPHQIPAITLTHSTSYAQQSPRLGKFNSPLLTLPLCLLLAACGNPKAASTPPPAAKVPAVSDAKVDAQILQAIAEPVNEPSTSDTAADEVTEIMRRYPQKTAKELLETPEIKAKLAVILKELMERKDLQNRLNASVAAAASFKGLDPTPGKHAFRLDVSNYSEARTRSLLTAITSSSATRVVDFLIGEVGEATPELSLGGLQQSSNGVSILATPPPGKP